MDSIQLAQSSPMPQMLPFPGPIPKENLPPEVFPGMLMQPPVYRAHGDTCLFLPFGPSQETMDFMARCPLARPGVEGKGLFLDPGHPECSCAAFHDLFPDYVQMNLKLFNKATYVWGTEYGLALFVVLFLLIGFLLWFPIGYFISIRRIKRRFDQLGDHHRFHDWHERLWTRNLALVLVVSGLLMIAYSIQGEAVVEIGDIMIKTNFIGLAICGLGVVLWLRLGARGLPSRNSGSAGVSEPDAKAD